MAATFWREARSQTSAAICLLTYCYVSASSPSSIPSFHSHVEGSLRALRGPPLPSHLPQSHSHFCSPMQVCAHEAQMLPSSQDLSSQGQICTSGYLIVTLLLPPAHVAY